MKAWRKLFSCAITPYHFSDSPSGGKLMMLPAVNDAPSTTTVGADSVISATIDKSPDHDRLAPAVNHSRSPVIASVPAPKSRKTMPTSIEPIATSIKESVAPIP